MSHVSDVSIVESLHASTRSVSEESRSTPSPSATPGAAELAAPPSQSPGEGSLKSEVEQPLQPGDEDVKEEEEQQQPVAEYDSNEQQLAASAVSTSQRVVVLTPEQQKVQELTIYVDNLETRLSRKDAEVEALRQELRARDAEVARLRQEVDDLSQLAKEGCDDEKVLMLTDKVAKLEKELASKKAAKGETRKADREKIIAYQKRIEELEDALEARGKTSVAAASAHSAPSAASEVGRLHAALQNSNEMLARARGDVAALQKELAAYRQSAPPQQHLSSSTFPASSLPSRPPASGVCFFPGDEVLGYWTPDMGGAQDWRGDEPGWYPAVVISPSPGGRLLLDFGTGTGVPVPMSHVRHKGSPAGELAAKLMEKNPWAKTIMPDAATATAVARQLAMTEGILPPDEPNLAPPVASRSPTMSTTYPSAVPDSSAPPNDVRLLAAQLLGNSKVTGRNVTFSVVGRLTEAEAEEAAKKILAWQAEGRGSPARMANRAQPSLNTYGDPRGAAGRLADWYKTRP